jgi:cardiolipin synthase
MPSASSLALCRRLWFLGGTISSQRFILAFLALLFGGCAKMAFRRVPAEVAPVRSAEFREKLASVAMARWTGGNSVRTLENGDNFFPTMLSAAESAKRSITFACYTAGDGPPVADFSRALAGRARAGVKVHVILDATSVRS